MLVFNTLIYFNLILFITRTDGNRTHNYGFEDHCFTTKLLPFNKVNNVYYLYKITKYVYTRYTRFYTKGI